MLGGSQNPVRNPAGVQQRACRWFCEVDNTGLRRGKCLPIIHENSLQTIDGDSFSGESGNRMTLRKTSNPLIVRFLSGWKRMLGGEARRFPSDSPETTRFVSHCAKPQGNKGLRTAKTTPEPKRPCGAISLLRASGSVRRPNPFRFQGHRHGRRRPAACADHSLCAQPAA
jgi:hypothetical protein